MIQTYLPKSLWNFTIMTAVHLIDRLLSMVIRFRNPIEFIEKKFPKVKLRNGLKT